MTYNLLELTSDFLSQMPVKNTVFSVSGITQKYIFAFNSGSGIKCPHFLFRVSLALIFITSNFFLVLVLGFFFSKQETEVKEK